MRPSWTIITVTYNSERQLAEFWSDFAGSPSIEWVVVDNASSDGSAALARTLGATVWELDSNVGFSAANNYALNRTESEYVLFANPDLKVVASDLAELAAAVDELGGFVAPQLLNPDGTLQPNGRTLPFLWAKVIGRVLGDRRADSYYRYAQDGERVPVSWAIGAALAANRDLVKRLGGWDDSFFVYYEDSDICLRTAALGESTHVVGSIRWEHGWARETTKFSLGPWKREFRAARVFYRRYPVLLAPPIPLVTAAAERSLGAHR